MSKLYAIADQYYDLKVYTFPSSQSFAWSEWRNESIAGGTYTSFDWEGADHLYGVAGAKGVRAIKINVEGLDEDNIWHIVRDSIKLLNLGRYPWVIRYFNTLYIIVESADDVRSTYMIPKYANVRLLWQDYFQLPSFKEYPAKFYFNGFPIVSPKHVDNKVLFDYLGTIESFITELKKEKAEGGDTENSTIKELGLFGSRTFMERLKAKEYGLTVSEYRKFKKEEEKHLQDFKNHIDRKRENKKKKIIGIAILVGLALLIGLICSSDFRMMVLAFVMSIVVAGAIYLILNDLIDSFIKAFRETPKGKRGRLILSGIVMILLFIIIYGGILIGLYAIPDLLND